MNTPWQCDTFRVRRVILVCLVVLLVGGIVTLDYYDYRQQSIRAEEADTLSAEEVRRADVLALASDTLNELEVRDRDPRDGYARENFSPEGWTTIAGCDMRNRILQRDLVDIELDKDGCTVESGLLEEGPFTGKPIEFERGTDTSWDIHIEHIVAVSDAWQKGAQQLGDEERHDFFNDPLNLIAIDGPTNMEKGSADAGEWMPPNEAYHCRYIARQIAIKYEHELWLSQGEYEQMRRTLATCPAQPLPITNATTPTF